MDELTSQASRRQVLGGGLTGAGLLASPGIALAAGGDAAKLAKAVAAGHDAAVQRLRNWIALPSIAAENRNYPAGPEYMKQLALDAGFQHAEVVPTSGKPGVFATLDAGAKRTVGLYFMYDVKQYVPEEWDNPPLEGRIIDKPGFGKVITARGAVNQKGPESAMLAALHAFKAAGLKLPVNLVLVAEGEEEIGSPHFRELVTAPQVMAAVKKCEGVMIPSADQNEAGGVEISLGAKGIIELELVASGAKWGRGPLKDVHSSLKAMIDSPVWRLVQALQTLVSADGNTVTIEGWYDNVRPLSVREKALIADGASKSSQAELMKAYGVQHWIDDLPFVQALERLASQPTVNIEGLVAGYTGPGGKTVLPGKATAKIDCRLVPDMTRAEATAKLRAHLDKHGFKDVEANVTGGYDPTEVAENSRLIRAAIATYKRGGASVSINPRQPGSWPGAVFTAAPVSIPAGSFGLGYGTGAHAPNEFYVLESSNPKIAGYDQAALGFADFLYQMAAVS
ncbi:M20/M25/M40 family metallo-hydrolase [Novosphingobium sp.]|uniref:M20/M25/M40 family metallo-hydrolase n=1 Tax=Novosphingobium sp. TaxID=1874826 RepID=UPI0025CEF39E|nr:M20/M25/M40 family metallo-hydrolase [Novosphingobium sp.]